MLKNFWENENPYTFQVQGVLDVLYELVFINESIAVVVMFYKLYLRSIQQKMMFRLRKSISSPNRLKDSLMAIFGEIRKIKPPSISLYILYVQ